MSNQRVPRWLTEGVSVYEEGREKPSWRSEMEVPFALALERDQVLKLRDLNSGFTKPDTIALCTTRRRCSSNTSSPRGQAALNTLVRVYGEGAEGDAAISKGLGISLDELQATFDKMLDARPAPSGRRCGTSRSRPNQAVRLTNGRPATLPP